MSAYTHIQWTYLKRRMQRQTQRMVHLIESLDSLPQRGNVLAEQSAAHEWEETLELINGALDKIQQTRMRALDDIRAGHELHRQALDRDAELRAERAERQGVADGEDLPDD